MSGMQSATRVVRVMEHLAVNPQSRLDDIAEILGVHKSNASRLMSTLRELAWVSSDEDHTQYSLGPRMIVLGRAAAPREEFTLALEIAERVSEATGETVNLSVPGHDSMITVGEVESKQALRVSMGVGSTDSFGTTAVGKLYLASLSDARLDKALDSVSFDARTPYSITDRAELEAELARIREAGFATNVEEEREGISAFALPLTLNDSRGVPLILSLTGPSTRWTKSVIDEQVVIVRELVEPFVGTVREPV